MHSLSDIAGPGGHEPSSNLVRHTAETLVFLHSLGTDGRLWRHQVAALGATHQILTLDAPGHGGRAWPGSVSHDGWLKDLDDQLADAGPVHLIGLSMGAHLAAVYAAARPERVRSLVVANSFAVLPERVVEDRVQDAATGIRRGGMAGYATEYLAQTLTRAIDDVDYAALHDAIASVSPAAYLGSASLTFGGDVRPHLARVGCPNLVLSGGDDHKVPAERVTEMLEVLPGSRHVVLPDAGHLSCVEQPEAFTRVLTEFVNEVGTSRSVSEGVAT